jgi:hypothetical protein
MLERDKDSIARQAISVDAFSKEVGIWQRLAAKLGLGDLVGAMEFATNALEMPLHSGARLEQVSPANRCQFAGFMALRAPEYCKVEWNR